MERGKILDIGAVIVALTCMVVVLVTLLMCLPSGRWAVDANSAGEMYVEVGLIGLGAPFAAWRLLRFMLRAK